MRAMTADPMAKRVAVITDATSSGHLFPYWQRYYGGQFGAANLNVVTYAGLKKSFDGLGLGDVEELPSQYDDTLRAIHVSKRVMDLLENYDVVVRCDVDEFLIPDPDKHLSLAAYLDGLTKPYVTAVGLDLVEVEDDPPLVLDGRPLLAQREWCVKTAALNKTAVTSIPMTWSAGFHASTVIPDFGDLYLVHTKFADVSGRVAWFTEMLDRVRPGSSESVYYSDGRAKIEGFRRWLCKLDRKPDPASLKDTAFLEQFIKTVHRNPVNGIYQGEFCIDRTLTKHPYVGRQFGV